MYLLSYNYNVNMDFLIKHPKFQIIPDKSWVLIFNVYSPITKTKCHGIHLKCIWLNANKHDLLWISAQELHLHGNSIGDEGIRSLMTGLASHKGKPAVLSSDIDHIIYTSIIPL